MFNFKNKIFVFLGLSLVAQVACAAIGFSILGIADISQISATGKSVGSQTAYGGGGLILNLAVDNDYSIETGALTFSRQWSDTTNGSNTISSEVFEVPVILHYHLSNMFSVGGGAYYTTNVGSLNETGSVSNSGLSYAEYGIKNYDYGLILDAGFEYPIVPQLLFQAHGRYLYGLPDVSTVSGTSFKFRDVQILAGVTFLFGI